MARYQYAKNENGEIVKAVDLVGQEVKVEYKSKEEIDF